eukprot:3955014-Pyramimonas_sp.AAC.1
MRPGVLSRFRERLRGLQCARAGHPHPDPHRYRCLLRGCEKSPLFLVMDTMPAARAHGVENARIAFCRPRAHNH